MAGVRQGAAIVGKLLCPRQYLGVEGKMPDSPRGERMSSPEEEVEVADQKKGKLAVVPWYGDHARARARVTSTHQYAVDFPNQASGPTRPGASDFAPVPKHGSGRWVDFPAWSKYVLWLDRRRAAPHAT